MKKKTILIDLSSLLQQNIISGIQRVVIETIKGFFQLNYSLILFYYDKTTNSFLEINNDSFMSCCYMVNRIPKLIINQNFDFNKLDEKYILFDVDSVFDCANCYPRDMLYKKCKTKNVMILSMIYDLLPFENPHFFPQYGKSYLYYLSNIIKYSDYIIISSSALKLKLENLFQILKIEKKLFIIPLGCDLTNNFDKLKISEKLIEVSNKEKYILIVSTIEIRKNHIYLLKNFENTENVNLIIAGRIGWLCDETLNYLKNSKLMNKRIFMFNNLNNDEIIYLYKNAYLSVFPSLDEGYGLPIVESLFYKCPVLANDIPVFREISNNKIDFFDANIKDSLNKKLQLYLNNREEYEKLKKLTLEYKPITWEDSISYYKKMFGEILK